MPSLLPAIHKQRCQQIWQFFITLYVLLPYTKRSTCGDNLKPIHTCLSDIIKLNNLHNYTYVHGTTICYSHYVSLLKHELLFISLSNKYYFNFVNIKKLKTLSKQIIALHILRFTVKLRDSQTFYSIHPFRFSSFTNM